MVAPVVASCFNFRISLITYVLNDEFPVAAGGAELSATTDEGDRNPNQYFAFFATSESEEVNSFLKTGIVFLSFTNPNPVNACSRSDVEAALSDASCSRSAMASEGCSSHANSLIFPGYNFFISGYTFSSLPFNAVPIVGSIHLLSHDEMSFNKIVFFLS